MICYQPRYFKNNQSTEVVEEEPETFSQVEADKKNKKTMSNNTWDTQHVWAAQVTHVCSNASLGDSVPCQFFLHHRSRSQEKKKTDDENDLLIVVLT